MTIIDDDDEWASTRGPRWLRQLASAVRINASDLDLWSLALSGEHGGDPLAVAQAAALHVRTVLPYRFEGQRHRVLDLAGARRRGWGACADASAAVAAAVLMAGAQCALCYERTEALDSYAHVRIAFGDQFIDSFPDASLAVDRCAATLRVTKGVVRWPVRAEEAAVALLAAQRRQDGPP